MNYPDFEEIITPARIGRYLAACGGSTRKAMTLYRKNIKLSQELFTVISCFEIALRNTIDKHYTLTLGNDWLQNAASSNGIFDNNKCRLTQSNINEAIRNLNHSYTHFKLIAELGFGFWRYLFANNQFIAAGSTLLQILPAKPRSTPSIQYNHNYILNQLAVINDLRNRIAHHEPICFVPGQPVKNTMYSRNHHNLILQLFQWMHIDSGKLLFGLDHTLDVCDEIDNL
ncbi:MAG: Abi family protein [Prolixibacteraceae bacterium]|nr:Abi family protein [Prolixibacteraceae bacterium]